MSQTPGRDGADTLDPTAPDEHADATARPDTPPAPGPSGLAHSITGSGPTVVLFHGVCHRRHAWDAVVPALSRRLRVVTVDLPGHGDSPEVPADSDALPYSLDLLTRFLHEVTPEGEKPHLAGNSLGGWAALELAARGEAASATAISPAGFFRSAADQARAIRVFRALRAVAKPLLPMVPTLARTAAGRSAFMSVFCAKPWRYPERAMVIDAPALVTNRVIDHGLTADFGFTPHEGARFPVTVQWGRRDRVLPWRQSRLVTKAFPDAALELTPWGHVPMTDDPEGVASAILRTVDRAERN